MSDNTEEEIYFCHQCKKIIHNLNELYFVEENSPRGFCSDLCIEEFYSVLVKELSLVDERIKKSLKDVKKESEDENALLQKVLNSPDEVFEYISKLDEKYYYFFKKYRDLYIVSCCFMYDNAPSFVLLLTYSQDARIFDFYKKGKNVNFKISGQEPATNEQSFTRDLIEFVELKKSEFIGKIIEIKKEEDFGFEEYHLFDKYTDETLSNFDYKKSHEFTDLGEVLFLSKLINHQNKNVFFLLIVLKTDTISIPILTCPSNSSHICEYFLDQSVFQKN